jgi:hypothetical protein
MAPPARDSCAVILASAGIRLTARADGQVLFGFLLATHPDMAGADAAEAAAEALHNLPVLSRRTSGKQTELPATSTPAASPKRARLSDSNAVADPCTDQPEDLQSVVPMTTSRLRRIAESVRRQQLRQTARMKQEDIARVYSLLLESSSHHVPAFPLEGPLEGVSVVVSSSGVVPLPVGSQISGGGLMDSAAAAAAGPSDHEEGFEAPAAAE